MLTRIYYAHIWFPYSYVVRGYLSTINTFSFSTQHAIALNDAVLLWLWAYCLPKYYCNIIWGLAITITKTKPLRQCQCHEKFEMQHTLLQSSTAPGIYQSDCCSYRITAGGGGRVFTGGRATASRFISRTHNSNKQYPGTWCFGPQGRRLSVFRQLLPAWLS
jgi:hypothetical protein